MPLAREPSQRTKAWVKWNYGQNSSKSSLKSPAGSEIIHLGGSRVGSPETTPSRPGTAQESDRPCTTWFPSPYAPPPEPPIGIARSRTEPQESQYSQFTPGAKTASFNSMSSKLSPAPLSIPTGKFPSPLTSAGSASSSSKRSSPPPYSIASPDSTSSESSKQLRRTRSAADLQRREGRERSGPRVLPPRVDSLVGSDARDSQDSASVLHIGQLIQNGLRENEPERVTQWFPLPPPTSPPPNKPLPAIRAHSPTSSVSSKGSPTLHAATQQSVQYPVQQLPLQHPVSPPSPPAQQPVQQKQQQQPVQQPAQQPAQQPVQQPVLQEKALPQRPISRLSPQERLWLHRNYRGEATFLKAWGLSIEKGEDRDEGVSLMRELMTGEDEKKKATKAQKARDLGLPDGGLQIIIEEERASLSEPDKPSPKMIDPLSLNKPQGLRVPGRGNLSPMSPTERHLRSESESSVLGAYLDIRMSRMD